MRLKQTEHLVARGHLLALEDSLLRLADDPLHEQLEPIELGPAARRARVLGRRRERAHLLGLLAALHRIPITMKTVDHSPDDKLAELFAPILAGGMHVKELETSPHPLVHDPAVAHAFGQESFASASGVNALLRAVTPESVAVLKQELQQVTAPSRHRLLRTLSSSSIVVDFDPQGLVVSDQAATYEGADYGSMGEGGGLAKG